VVVHPAPVQWHELHPPFVTAEIISELFVAFRAPAWPGPASGLPFA